MFKQILAGLSLLALAAAVLFSSSAPSTTAAEKPNSPETAPDRASKITTTETHRAPVDVVIFRDKFLVTANQGSNSISLLDATNGQVLDELACPSHPAKVVVAGDKLLVSCQYAGKLLIVRLAADKQLKVAHQIELGNLPLGIAAHPDGRRAFVGLTANGTVAEIDLFAGKVVNQLPVGKWPRYLAVSPNGKRLAVGLSGESKIAVVDIESRKLLYSVSLVGGINLGHMICSDDSKYVYFPWMVYRSNPVSVFNIQRGWVLASRIGRVNLNDETAYREAISLDVPRKAVADPHGIALSNNQQRLVVAASGTHELLVYRNPDLPYIGTGGPGDLIDRRLLRDRDLFNRIDLGGRPMGVVIADDNRTAYVANYLKDCVQVVDLVRKSVEEEYSLGPRPKQTTQVRRGMEIFYDGQRSLDQWYSCHSCHYNGGSNSRAMDTMNDGSQFTDKTVLPLFNVGHTKPWTWHGWQKDLNDAMHKSFTVTMQGRRITNRDAEAVLAFLNELKLPPNPNRTSDGSLTAQAERGKAVFRSKAAGCSSCHTGRFFTDGKIHDVGLGDFEDRYEGFNTPSLLGLYRKVRFLHDGRAKTLDDLLTDDHAPEKVAGERALTKQEREDLIAYLLSL